MKKFRRTVIGIPASYDDGEGLETISTKKYLNYLTNNGVSTVMTTAGTSHFNLLSLQEIHELNKAVVTNFNGQKIIGVPALSTKNAIEFVKQANSYADRETNLMLLYPDRFYNKEHIIKYMSEIRSETENKIYIHGKTIRKAVGGSWDYDHEVLNHLFNSGVLEGIKEEHSNLYKSYDFIANLNKDMDIIVAGGSMRRFEFLETAGAKTFLSGIGNFFPQIEQKYLNGEREYALSLEKKLFNIFMKIGWHKSLRIALDILDLTCYNNRNPWPTVKVEEIEEIKNILKEIQNEK